MARQWKASPLIEAAELSLRATARRLGVDPAILCRPLTDRQADAYATRLDLRPDQVWGPDWWDDDDSLTWDPD